MLSHPLSTKASARTFALALVLMAAHSVSVRSQSPDSTESIREFTRFALGHDGDPQNGETLFHQDARTACAQCHSVDGSASKAGPDLQAAGEKFPRHELIRAVTEPSAEIAIGYDTTIVETTDGEERQGVIKESTAEAIELMGADGRSARIPRDEIRSQRGSDVSLMPEGLHAGLTREEFADLIAYLTTLRPPEDLLAANAGMPGAISELERPVGFRPFFSEQLRFHDGSGSQPGNIQSGLVWFGQLPGSSNRFVAAHQTGKIWLLEKGAHGDSKTLFGDLAGEIFNERGPNGLLGLAFHPNFESNGRYYLKHQVFEDGAIVTAVSERRASGDRLTDSGRPSRRLWQVRNVTQNHSGGCVGFGPDGFLYIAMGDTGPQKDPNGHGQDPTTHLGKILRIDVDRADPGLPYAIPPDNPFVGHPTARPEIWAYGFREPWRFSFDPLTDDLWVGDVGQDRIEEAAIVRRGENHGWNVFEGFEPFSNEYRKEGERYTPPVFAYNRAYGNSITGGRVYRGDVNSPFYGVYICGDYTSRILFGVQQVDRKLRIVRRIGVCPQGIASFAEDAQGNLYAVGYEGMVYRLEFEGRRFDPPPATAARVSN